MPGERNGARCFAEGGDLLDGEDAVYQGVFAMCMKVNEVGHGETGWGKDASLPESARSANIGNRDLVYFLMMKRLS